MTLRAKHNFRLQLKIGEYVEFVAGQVVPEHFYKGDSPFATYIRDHCESGIIRPQVVIPPEMARIRDLPLHVQQQESAREKIMVHPSEHHRLDDNGGQQAISAIPQKQDGAPKPVPKIEPKRTRK